jgi:hypothetical protein
MLINISTRKAKYIKTNEIFKQEFHFNYGGLNIADNASYKYGAYFIYSQIK